MTETLNRTPVHGSGAEALSKTIWDWLVINPDGNVCSADAAIAFGGRKLAVAYQTAEIGKNGLVDTIVTSGKRTRLTAHWPKVEAGVFADIIRDLGFKGRLLEEGESGNSGDNLLYSYLKLLEEDIDPKTLICVMRAPIQRRVRAVALKKLPSNVEVVITSPDLDFKNHVTEDFEDLVRIMTGEVDRMRTYHLNGFQIEDIPPNEVIEARERLVKMGFNTR